MFLYLMRHGSAARSAPEAQPSLTPAGLAEVRKVAEHFRLGLYKVDALWHSPLLRAEQTAKAFWEVLEDPGLPLEPKDFLTPDSTVEEALGGIEAFEGSLLIVSHLPFLPTLASRLLARSAVPAFPTAGLSAFGKGKGFRHLWSIEPGELR